jgi:hypothetical protein
MEAFLTYLINELPKSSLLIVIAFCFLFIGYLMRKEEAHKKEKDLALIEALNKLDQTITKINEKLERGEREFRDLDVRMTSQESICRVHQDEKKEGMCDRRNQGVFDRRDHGLSIVGK